MSSTVFLVVGLVSALAVYLTVFALCMSAAQGDGRVRAQRGRALQRGRTLSR